MAAVDLFATQVQRDVEEFALFFAPSGDDPLDLRLREALQGRPDGADGQPAEGRPVSEAVPPRSRLAASAESGGGRRTASKGRPGAGQASS